MLGQGGMGQTGQTSQMGHMGWMDESQQGPEEKRVTRPGRPRGGGPVGNTTMALGTRDAKVVTHVK